MRATWTKYQSDKRTQDTPQAPQAPQARLIQTYDLNAAQCSVHFEALKNDLHHENKSAE